MNNSDEIIFILRELLNITGDVISGKVKLLRSKFNDVYQETPNNRIKYLI